MNFRNGSLARRLCWMAILFAPSLATARPDDGYAPVQNATQSNQVSKPDKNATADASDYVGAETCKTCHEDLYNSWEKSPHWKTTLNSKGGPSHQGCEGCHGPGAAQVAGGGDKTKIFIFKDPPPRKSTSAA